MLDSYIEHIEGTSNESLLARIYGIFTFKTNHFKPLDILVMQNTARSKSSNTCFDLKGSLIGRYSLSTSLLKDMNFLELGTTLSIHDQHLKDINKIIRLDSQYLCS